MNHNINLIVDEIVNGRGYYIIEGCIDTDTIAYASRFIRRVTKAAYPDSTLERRVWDLHKKNGKFSDIANNTIVKGVFNKILGTKHKISSFGANQLMPDAPAQEPHTDYPYWGLFDPDSLPMDINSSFTMACQLLVPLTDFTTDNGATEVVPGTQKLCRYPDPVVFDREHVKLDLKAGDMLLYHSLLWHRAGNNRSEQDRITLLGQYTAYFVKDMM